LHLIGEDDTYTNLAFLLSDQCSHTLKLAVFEGSKKTVFKDRQELTGSLLEQLEEAFAYIERYNRTRAEFSGLDRVDLRDYPPEAVREALLNAIVHRDYAFSGSTLISIFEDRIEFVTIGGLVKGITLEDVKLGVSVLRNQHLANIFYRLRLIEAYGTGILKINESYDEHTVKPVIETTNNAFKITLPNSNYQVENQGSLSTGKANSNTSGKKDARIATILKLCQDQGSIVRTDVEKALGVSQATAILLLRGLVDDGVLIKKGKGRNLRYYESK
ncbi:MAG: AAA family ATPase, partial [Clostridiales bacterium]|nr:AAA family ATPase [Clostridiales bacterium]